MNVHVFPGAVWSREVLCHVTWTCVCVFARFKAELQFSGVTGWHAGCWDALQHGNTRTFNTFLEEYDLGLDFLFIHMDGLELAGDLFEVYFWFNRDETRWQ